MTSYIIDTPGVLSEIAEDTVAILDPGMLYCETVYIGICGSDRRLWRGEMPAASYPRIPGHEVVALVVHSTSNKFRAGEVIAVNPYKNCGECVACLANKPNACVHNETFGVQRNGLMRDFFTLDATRAISLPFIESDVIAGRVKPYWSLVEPLALVIHAATRAQYALDAWSGKTDVRAVVGGGNLGKLTSAYLASQGYSVVMASDKAEHLAETPGVKIVSRLEMIKAYNNSADVVYVTGDNADDIFLATETATNGGVIVVLSHGALNTPSKIIQNLLVFKEVSLLGSRNATNRDFFASATMLKTAGHYLEPVITKTYGFDKYAIAAALLDRGNKSVVTLR